MKNFGHYQFHKKTESCASPAGATVKNQNSLSSTDISSSTNSIAFLNAIAR